MDRRATDRGTPFIGRAAERQRLADFLGEGARLVTLTGVAGIGKSRLARRFIQEAMESDEAAWQGQVVCDLAGARSRADVVTSLSAALEFHLASGETGEATEDRLGRALAGRGAILVLLDTFDPVAEHAAGTLGRWLDLAPDARFLVTTRSRLRLRGEVCFELGPLPSAEGIELFARTARRARDDWAPSSEDGPVIAELVERLDGIPLAIELAASRITVLSPAKMLQRMSKRFDLLRGGPSDAITRQLTLRAAFDWSWGMLSDPEKSALAQLSVFRGGFSVDGAEGVVVLAEGQGDVLDVLESLRGRSLVSSDDSEGAGGEPHFRLYESIREYASERAAEQGLLAEAKGRHGDFFVAQGEARIDDFGAPGRSGHRWFEDNRDNLLAVVHRFSATVPEQAARAALCLAHVMIHRGPFDSPQEMLEGVLNALGGEGAPELRCRLLLSRGIARSGVGRLDEGNADLNSAAELAGQEKLGSLEAKSLLHLGLNALRHGRLPEARDLLERSTEAALACGSERVRGRALVSMGMCLEAAANFAEAEASYTEALEVARQNSDPWEEVRTRSKMGSLCSFIAGREQEARSHFEWAHERSREVGDWFIETSTAYNLGRLNLNLGLLEEADRFLERALDNFREMGNLGSVGFVRTARGLLELERGQLAAARQELDEATRLLGAAEHRLAWSYALAMAALVDLARDDVPQAIRAADQALEPVAELGHGVLQGVVHCVRALAGARGGDASSFASARQQARSFLEESNWGEGRALLAVLVALDDEGRLQPEDAPKLESVGLASARAAWRLVGAGGGSAEQRVGNAAKTRPIARAGELLVEPSGRWFRLGEAEAVDLSRKRTLRPLLLALVRLSLESPGEALDVDGVFEAVWPGERILPEAKKNRVYVAVATLRKTGLDAVLDTRGDGYLLKPGLPVNWAED
ncbi:MAG: tetratricopeptide repeat protein [Myxococcota bacterium]|nr:tetratricopeptide repeat protein [Myxococcota bacterium]